VPGLTIGRIVVPGRGGAYTPHGISSYAMWLLLNAPARDAHLGVGVCKVPLYRCLREMQAGCYLPVGEPLAYQHEHLQIPRRDAIVAGRSYLPYHPLEHADFRESPQHPSGCVFCELYVVSLLRFSRWVRTVVVGVPFLATRPTEGA